VNNNLLYVFVFHVDTIDIMSALLQRVCGLLLVQVYFGCDIHVYSGAPRGKAAPAEQHGSENLVTHR